MSPQIDAIVLAAGLSTRTGERNKLLLPLAGKPPYYRERRGHPVLFPRSMFSDLLQLSGDTGARDLLEQLESTILQIDVNDEGIFFNVNRPADL